MYLLYVNTAGLDLGGKFFVYVKNIAEKTLKNALFFSTII